MKRTTLCLVLLACAPLASGANWPERPFLHAVRATSPVVIDGDLSDAAWQAAPAFTDFTQHDPDDGKPSTLPTSVKILYDDKAVYFGAKMVDDHPPTALLSRRDVLVNGDFLSINIDSQHDRLSGNAFTVTPAGEQGDTVLYNDIGEDPSWDGVWESAVKTVPDGWIAEVRIPFSQLRFPDRDKQVWGINITRRIFRLQETVRIVNTPKGGVGFVSHFADLAGIEEIHRGKPLELVPYAVGRSDVQSRFDRTDPFLQSSKEKIDGGLDLKYALTSTLTLTGTVNPDFGQVEVDPAVVNLTQFETFYPEKRPFFTEGFQIFSFGDSPAPEHWNFTSIPTFFYSRRIGRAPQGTVNADFVDEPTTTTILGAAKVTGKVGKWTVGVLDALTDNETARFATGPLEQRQTVEPMSNYFVTRDTRDFGSNSRIGIMVTSVDRRLPEELSYLRSRADMVGIDGYNGTANNNWIFEWFAAGSHLAGSAESIADAQNAPERYYGRPDAKSFHLDPTRTSLQGWAGKAMLSKATGLWRGLVQVQAYSPGFETNDVGFMTRTDTISTNAVIHYDNDHPTERFREKHVWFGAWSNQNFDDDALGRGVFAEHSAVLASYWNYDTNLFLSPDVLDDRLTRGGPLVRARRSWDTTASLGSDNRKHFYFAVSAHANGAAVESHPRRNAHRAAVAEPPGQRLADHRAPSRSHAIRDDGRRPRRDGDLRQPLRLRRSRPADVRARDARRLDADAENVLPALHAAVRRLRRLPRLPLPRRPADRRLRGVHRRGRQPGLRLPQRPRQCRRPLGVPRRLRPLRRLERKPRRHPRRRHPPPRPRPPRRRQRAIARCVSHQDVVLAAVLEGRGLSLSRE
jgi:hypothetical protein